MAEYTIELATDITFPHIDIYRKYCDGELYGYRALTHDGYVMYNTAANDTDPETGEPVTYYCERAEFPKTKNFDNFSWTAVERPAKEDC